MLAFKNMFAVRPAHVVTMRSFSVMSALQKELPPILNEEQAELPKEIVSGAPPQMSESRVVRIWKESKAATQSGKHNTRNWKLDWDLLGKGNRWENDMMGYQGSADYMQGTIMAFDTKEGAIRFAKGQGWDYYVQEPRQRKFKKKEYAINFLHSTGPLKHIRTK